MKKYIISELWGSLLNDDLEFEARNRKEAINKYLEFRKFKAKIVYDSLKNHIMNNQNVICVQEGHFENGIKWIRGRRGFYQIIFNQSPLKN